MVPDLKIAAPKGGYLVPLADAARIGAKLKQHGIVFKVVGADQMSAEVEELPRGQGQIRRAVV